MNTFGNIFKLTTFGESHGEAIGGIIDGCPAGIILDKDFIHKELINRNPAHISGATKRREPDEVQFLSGIFDGKTLGTPIGFIIKNKNANSGDYQNLQNVFRPSHADFTYIEKYGIRDYRGGGRASAREHAVRVVAGAIAKQILSLRNIKITAWTSSVGNVIDNEQYNFENKNEINISKVRNPNIEISNKISELIDNISKDNDTIGGTVSCIVEGMPSGIGEPLFGKLQSQLASAMLSINASRGFEFGTGFKSSSMKGSENNDTFMKDDFGKITTKTNNEGGILGGISTGQNLFFKVAFKPISSIGKNQFTVNEKGESKEIAISGRHDICAAVRATSVVEAMTAIVILDMIMLHNAHKI